MPMNQHTETENGNDGLIVAAIVARMGLIKKAPKQKKPQSSKAKKAAQIRRVFRNAQNQN